MDAVSDLRPVPALLGLRRRLVLPEVRVIAVCIAIAAMLMLVCLLDFGTFTDTCWACGGTGEHREGCPNE